MGNGFAHPLVDCYRVVRLPSVSSQAANQPFVLLIVISAARSFNTDQGWLNARPVPLAERLRELLLDEIRRQRWVESLPSERHLSAQLHVSRPTLRAALRSLAASGVLQPRHHQPYRVIPGSFAPTQRRTRTPELLILYSSRARPNLAHFLPCVAELQHRLHPRGLGVHMFNLAPLGKGSQRNALRRIEDECFPGYYLLASVPASVHTWFEQQKLPAIILGSCNARIAIPSVEVDHAAAIQHAVGYLVRRRHRRIALLQVPEISVGDSLAAEAFQRACLQFKSQGTTGTLQTSIARPASVETSVRRLMLGPNRPTAVIVADLELALGLYTKLGQLGLAIPRDISVIVASHSPTFDFARPLPTCYQFSWAAVADRVTRLIEAHGRLGSWPRGHWRVFPRLREGASVAEL